MQYVITISTNTAAFDDSVSSEIEWILQRLARELHSSYVPPAKMILRDSNGNPVGSAVYQDEDGNED
jgi:hypothetical protein